MGTHPIFESDFDCLTECQSFVKFHVFLERTMPPWWKDQKPLETQDKSVATFRGGFWEAMIHPWFYTGPKHLMNFPSDPPAERLMEGHAWGDRPRFGRYNTFTYYGRFSVTASSIMTVVTLVILNKGYKRAKEVVNDATETVSSL